MRCDRCKATRTLYLDGMCITCWRDRALKAEKRYSEALDWSAELAFIAAGQIAP